MFLEFHTYTLVTSKREELLCYRPYTSLLHEYIDDRGITDCYLKKDAIRSFIIRIHRQLGRAPDSVNPQDYITCHKPVGKIFEGKIMDFSPFKDKKSALRFISGNSSYDYDLQKFSYPQDISISEVSKDLRFYMDPITRRKHFIDNHFYKDFIGILHRRRVRRVSPENIQKVKIISADSRFISLLSSMIQKEDFVEQPEVEYAKNEISEKLSSLIGEFPGILGIDIKEVIIRFGPYPPSKPVICLRPTFGHRIKLEDANKLVDFIQKQMHSYERFQKDYQIPDEVIGFYFEIIDETHRMPVYTNGIFNVDGDGLSIFC